MNAIAKIFLKPLEKLRRFCFRSKQQFITSNIEDIIKTNESIKSIINKGDAFMISRFGSEISVLNVYLQKQRNKMQFIEFKNRFEQYNFFSKVEIKKRIPSFNNMNLIHWQKKKYLTKIRNGWYCFSDTAINDKKKNN